MLREAEVELSKGQSIAVVANKLGIPDQTYSGWAKKFRGMKVGQAERLKDLEQENARLKRVVADRALDNAMLRQAARPNF